MNDTIQTPDALIIAIGARIQDSGRNGTTLQDLHDLTESYGCTTEQIDGIVEAFEAENHITRYHDQLRWNTRSGRRIQ